MRKPPPLSTAKSRQLDNRVRIIGGRWRGRKLAFPDGAGLRPTGDRIRETLFNWLMPVLPAARCLDMFAGSGALGFEALSRGAQACTFLERNTQAIRYLQDVKAQLSAADATIIAADTVQWLGSTCDVFDIVFIDPPFADITLSAAMLVGIMERRGTLAADPWIYVEQSLETVQGLPAGFTQHRSARAGQVSYALWRRVENIL